MTVVFMKSEPDRAAAWKRIFNERAPWIEFRAFPDVGSAREVTCLLTWDVPADLSEQFPSLEILYAIGAGVDHIDLRSIPKHVDLVRMVEPGIRAGMNEYVVMAVLGAHRDLVAYVAQMDERKWKELPLVPARERRVGIMGSGFLGLSVLDALKPFGFQLRLWSRSARRIKKVEIFSGADELESFLSGCEILVCLLPLTSETRRILNSSVFGALPSGAVVINVSRGGNLVQEDLIAALDRGHLRAAILDVCEPEPLAPDSPLWSHPKILLTPHIATRTHAESAADAVIHNLDRHRRGELMEHLVDRNRGY
jgi:glyoxylate/hydroxypyruvate reductase A